MKPFYSIDDLACMDDFWEPEGVASALVAAGVRLVYRGTDADVSKWADCMPKRDASGAMVVIRGLRLDPDPDEVMVTYESLPPTWQSLIARFESQEDALVQSGTIGDPQTSSEKPLSTRREKSLLRVIRALCAMAKVKSGDATAVEAQVQELGFPGPGRETIAGILKQAYDLEAE